MIFINKENYAQGGNALNAQQKKKHKNTKTKTTSSSLANQLTINNYNSTPGLDSGNDYFQSYQGYNSKSGGYDYHQNSYHHDQNEGPFLDSNDFTQPPPPYDYLVSLETHVQNSNSAPTKYHRKSGTCQLL